MPATQRSAFNLSLSQAARMCFDFPHPSPSTMNRWCATGVTGPDGKRVILRSERRGRYRYTSEQACREFMARLNPPTVADAEAELIRDGC